MSDGSVRAASERGLNIQPDALAEASGGDNTADIVVDRLIAWGVEMIFGVIGDSVNPLMEALRQRRDQIRYISVRHEEAAAFMASGYAKYTGRLGACLATSGPGAVHLVNGLYDAAFDHVPSKLAGEECDALLILGSTMPYLQYYPKPGQARCVQIDRDPTHIGLRHPVEIGLVGDVQATLRALLPKLRRRTDRTFLDTAQRRMKEWKATVNAVEAQRSTPLKPQFLVAQISRLLEPNAIISVDTGAHTIFCGRHLQLQPTQRIGLSGTLASMGSGLPFAIAAKLAFPDRQSVALVGDGGFTMLMGDLITAVKHKTPIKIVIFKNNSLAQDAWEQSEAGQEEFGAELEPIDFVKFGEACGVEAYRCTQPDEVEPVLRRAFGSPNIALVEAIVDPKEWPVKPDEVKA